MVVHGVHLLAQPETAAAVVANPVVQASQAVGCLHVDVQWFRIGIGVPPPGIDGLAGISRTFVQIRGDQQVLAFLLVRGGHRNQVVQLIPGFLPLLCLAVGQRQARWQGIDLFVFGVAGPERHHHIDGILPVAELNQQGGGIVFSVGPQS